MNNWLIVEPEFDPDKLNVQETVFTIGNGYLSTRGTFEEGYPNEIASTLVHGLFDDVPVSYSELANTPNWIGFHLFANKERFLMKEGQVSAYQRVLNMGNSVLTRQARWQLSSRQKLDVNIERFASLADEHILAIRYKVKSIDFSGNLEFRASLFGHAANTGLIHMDWIDQGSSGPQSAYIHLQTIHTKIPLAEAFYLDISGKSKPSYGYWDSLWTPELIGFMDIQPGEEITAVKLVSIYTGRDTPTPKEAALAKLDEAISQGYQALCSASDQAWSQEWERCNITIEGDDEADRALRFNIYELLIAAPRHDNRVSIAAKALSGFGYRGHVFWDTEIFILPFFTYTRPEIARNLLMYRYRTLAGARQKARANGFEGAMVAWESAGTGEETTPSWVTGPDGKALVRIWTGDIEHHISADIAYAVYQYWQVTGDDAFMRDYGAEIMLDIARFWGSRIEWNEASKRYEINDVIGPDENHEHVNNNAYTNRLARWCLDTAVQILDWLKQSAPEKARDLETALDLSQKRLSHWKDITDRLYLGYDAGSKLFEQFEGYFNLKDIDLASYEPRQRSMQAILGIIPAQEYQVIKQPDVLMLLYLLADEVDPGVLKANYEYYTPRTDLSYGSSLGPAIQVILSVRLGEIEPAYRLFMRSAQTDLENSRGNTPDGIHAATAGGIWQACVFGFGGLKLTADGPEAAPHLPSNWKRLQYRISYHGKPYQFDLRPAEQIAAPRLPVQGAIFDLDGVLTDTSELHYQGWKRLADEENIPFNRQDNEALRGVSRRDSLLLLLKGRPRSEEQILQMMKRKNEYYLESLRNLTPASLFPGARRFLEQVRQEGVKVAIGSASKNAREVIEKLGIGDLVDALSDGYSVERQKPAPDLFLHAAGQLGVPPEQCVVFEDAEAGIAAALAGGSWAVGIGPVERVGAAHIIINGLEESYWQCVIDRLRQCRVVISAPSSSFQTGPEFTNKGERKEKQIAQSTE
ncbi:MAG: beta-phosphoglucomutase [Omnitrophica WOR_2 bacterium]